MTISSNIRTIPAFEVSSRSASRKPGAGGMMRCRGSTITQAISRPCSAMSERMKSMSLKGAISISSRTPSGIPALSGTALGKLTSDVGARLICASADMP